MTTTRLAVFLAVLIGAVGAMALSPHKAVAAGPAAYRLNPGDELRISVWGQDNLDNQLVVLPDGMITFPLAGRVQAAGLTTEELEARLADALGPAIKDPHVSVTIATVAGNRVYVIGKVRAPGAYVLQAPTTIVQVLSLAGGLDKFAKASKIEVIRASDGGSRRIRFDLGDFLDGDAGAHDIELQAGDIIVVP